MNELANQPEGNAAAMLVLVERGEITTQLTARELRALEADLVRIIGGAEVTVSTVRESAGAELHGLPRHLVTMIDMGTGYLRHARDVIRALRKARGKRKGKG
jgi:hypothetical protein